jgi:hypothetical protein
LNVRATLEPFTLPLTVPLGPQDAHGSVNQVPVSEEPDWTIWKVAVVPVGKKPVPVHAPVSEAEEGDVGLGDFPQATVATSSAEIATRMRVAISLPPSARRAFSSSA